MNECYHITINGDSGTYTTGHNENETAAFEKLKMIEPLDRAVLFRIDEVIKKLEAAVAAE